MIASIAFSPRKYPAPSTSAPETRPERRRRLVARASAPRGRTRPSANSTTRPARIANGPGPSRIAPTARATRITPVRNAVGTSRPGPLRSDSAPTSIVVGSCQLGPPSPSATDADGGRLGLGDRSFLLPEERGDRDLLGRLGGWRFGFDPNFVSDGLGEVVGRSLDRLEVGCVLHGRGGRLCRLGVALLQLGDVVVATGELHVGGLGRRLDGFVLLGLGLEQERAHAALGLDLVVLVARRRRSRPLPGPVGRRHPAPTSTRHRTPTAPCPRPGS